MTTAAHPAPTASQAPAADHGFFVYPTMSPAFIDMVKRCMPCTMTTPARQFALHKAVHHIVAAGITGDYVECGVWRGGASMMAALTFLEAGDTARTLWLYDTYAGMPRPTDHDARIKVDGSGHGRITMDKWLAEQRDGFNNWCYASLDDVTANMRSTGYPTERLRFIRGMVEHTIPATIPERIALLRLDTDFYESTLHEMRHLYPRLAPGGVLIIDDYGVWRGSKLAVDEYLREIGEPLLLTSVDETAVVAVKPVNSKAIAA
jgi:hypothetical protein